MTSKLLLLLLLTIVCAPHVEAAFSAQTVWYVATTGNDNNGGCFVAGASGTNYGNQDSAQIAYTDMVIDATTNTKFTSAGNPVTSAHVGNCINVTGGTGFTVQRVYIVSQTGGVATCDKSLGTLSSTGGTGNLGGQLATITGAAGMPYVAGNKFFVKASATYTQTATATFATGGTPSNSALMTRVIGYTTTPGDEGRPTIQLSTNTGLSALKSTGNGVSFENFIIDCNSLGTSIGIESTATYTRVRNNKVSNCTSIGIKLTGVNQSILRNEVTGTTSAGTYAISVATNNAEANVERNYVHDNVTAGMNLGSGSKAIWNLIVNNTGASSDGIAFAGQITLLNNTIYGNGRHGLNGSASSSPTVGQIKNNLLISNGGYGLQLSTGNGWPADPDYDGNAYYINTSGARNRADDTSTNALNGSGFGPYTNAYDVTLSGDPFTNAAGGDFSLNNTAGAGAAARGAGTPGAITGTSLVGYIDMGALQHQDSATGGAKGAASTQ